VRLNTIRFAATVVSRRATRVASSSNEARAASRSRGWVEVSSSAGRSKNRSLASGRSTLPGNEDGDEQR
jgi:hypothetical protein